MKKILLMAIMVAAIVQPVQGKYEPEARIGEETKKEVRAARAALRKLPKKVRWALIAEKLGLCYMPTGEPGYSDKASYTKRDRVRYYPVNRGARFIGADGVEYDFGKILQEKKGEQDALWMQIKQAMHGAGVHAVLLGSADEVTRLCVWTARRRMHRMPEVMQDALIAELMGLYYVPGGGSAYQARKKGKVNGTDMELEFWQVDSKARFMDRTGTERTVAQMIEQREKKDAATRRAWIQVLWCCQLVGEKEALKEFADILKKMKKFKPQLR